ncbi:hypothetical protein GCM10010416_37630 [Streptomyces caniferus]
MGVPRAAEDRRGTDRRERTDTGGPRPTAEVLRGLVGSEVRESRKVPEEAENY